MRDGFRFVARVPYPVTEPKALVIASEVATMEYLRSYGIPVPKVYGYSATSENKAGTEYVFMEHVSGTNLGDIWFDMSEEDRKSIIAKVVELEARLFALRFPAGGSIYFAQDLPDETVKVPIQTAESTSEYRFCLGPDTTLGLWYRKRLNLRVGRGPCTHQLSQVPSWAVPCPYLGSLLLTLRKTEMQERCLKQVH